MVPLSCSLSEVELREQLDRYAVAGAGAEVVEWGRRRRVIRIASGVPGSLVDRLIEVERACWRSPCRPVARSRRSKRSSTP